MRKKTEEQISMKFIFFLIFMFAMTTYYVLKQDDIEKISKSRTYEEMLEFYDDTYYTNSKNKTDKENKEIRRERQKPQVIQEESIQKAKLNTNNKQSKEAEYLKLLDELKTFPYQSAYYVNNIVDRFLVFNGYPAGTIKIVSSNINQYNNRNQNGYIVANFDIRTGTLNLDETVLSKLTNETLIAVLVHELDHFDKIAGTCKYMGINNFVNLLNKNNIHGVDILFWKMASSSNKTSNFNGEYYKEALDRYTSQNKINQIGTYSDFYKLSENIRNPLEISAYEASDFVYKHYGIEVHEGPLQKLVKKFNDIDWELYNQIASKTNIRNERVSIFDYFYTQAILIEIPSLIYTYNECMNSKDGDLTDFWTQYKNESGNFYTINSQINADNFSKIMSLLNRTELMIKNGITDHQISDAIANKINALKNSVLDKDSLNNLKSTIENYMKIIKENNIDNKKQELICAILLICIENKLYKNDSNDEIALYYLEMPEFLLDIYNIKNKQQRLMPIYYNPAFKEEKPPSYSDQDYLQELLNKNRLNIG